MNLAGLRLHATRPMTIAGGAVLLAAGRWVGSVDASLATVLATTTAVAVAHLTVSALAHSGRMGRLLHARLLLDMGSASAFVWLAGPGAASLAMLLAALPHSADAAGRPKFLVPLGTATLYIGVAVLHSQSYGSSGAATWLPAPQTYFEAALLLLSTWLVSHWYGRGLARIDTVARALKQSVAGEYRAPTPLDGQPQFAFLQQAADDVMGLIADRGPLLSSCAHDIEQISAKLLDLAARLGASRATAQAALSELLASSAPAVAPSEATASPGGSPDLRDGTLSAAAGLEDLATAMSQQRAALSALADSLSQGAASLQDARDLTHQLSQHTSEIDSLARTTSKLGRQTHVLALNAAIEAAHAREHGHGFSVIADQVRRLAADARRIGHSVTDRSQLASQEVDDLAQRIGAAASALEQTRVNGQSSLDATAPLVAAASQLHEQLGQLAAAAARHEERTAQALTSASAAVALQDRCVRQAQAASELMEVQDELLAQLADNCSRLTRLAQDINSTIRPPKALQSMREGD